MAQKPLKLLLEQGATKFWHPESVLASTCKYGVLIRQVHRYIVAFMVPSVKLYSYYLAEGHNKRYTNRYFSSFIHNVIWHTARPATFVQQFAR